MKFEGIYTPVITPYRDDYSIDYERLAEVIDFLINAGVSGDTTAGGLARVGWTMTPEVDAVIVALGGNDMLRGLDPAEAESNLGGILQAVTDAGLPALLVGLEAPANYGPDYKAAFDGAYIRLSETYGVGLHADIFAPLRTRPDFTAYLQADMIHPSADGVGLIVEALGPKVLELIAQAQSER